MIELQAVNIGEYKGLLLLDTTLKNEQKYTVTYDPARNPKLSSKLVKITLSHNDFTYIPIEVDKDFNKIKVVALRRFIENIKASSYMIYDWFKIIEIPFSEFYIHICNKEDTNNEIYTVNGRVKFPAELRKKVLESNHFVTDNPISLEYSTWARVGTDIKDLKLTDLPLRYQMITYSCPSQIYIENDSLETIDLNINYSVPVTILIDGTNFKGIRVSEIHNREYRFPAKLCIKKQELELLDLKLLQSVVYCYYYQHIKVYKDVSKTTKKNLLTIRNTAYVAGKHIEIKVSAYTTDLELVAELKKKLP